MFFSFSPTEILYISSRVLLYVFTFNFSFCVNNGLEKKIVGKTTYFRNLCVNNKGLFFINVIHSNSDVAFSCGLSEILSYALRNCR